MTLKFYTTGPVIPRGESWSSHHHNVPQEYIGTILKQKIPDSELIISESGEIIKILNESFLEVNQKEKEELARFEQAKYDLISEYGEKINYIRRDKSLFRFNGEFDDFRINNSTNYTTEVKRAMYKKYVNERGDFMHCLSCWIGEEDSELAKLENIRFPIKSEISGIIVPIAHADWSDLPSIISNIKGDFKTGLEREVKDMKKWDVEEEVKGQYFFNRFHIPIFNSPDFAPGHRHINKDNKAYNDWLVEDSHFEYNWKEKIKHVEFAYGLWLDRNFLKKDLSQ